MTLYLNYWSLISFSLLIITGPYWPIMPDWQYLVFPVLMIGLSIKYRKMRYAFGSASACIVIFLHGNLLEHQTEKLFKAGQDITINAEVDSLFKPIKRGFQGRVIVRSINGQSLSIFHQPKITLTAPLLLQLGDTVTAKVSLKPITGLLNEVGFDAESYALSQGVVGAASVNKSVSYYVVSHGSLRGAALTHFKRSTPSLQNRDIVQALLFGVRDEIEQARWIQLQQSGLSHLIAISGLHIGIAFGVGWGMGRLLLRVHWQLIFCPALCGVLLALTYAWLAGFSIPTQRAMLMCLVLVVVQSFSGHLSYRYKWLLVLALLLMASPWSVLSSSLWLSMFAVGVVFFFLATSKKSQPVLIKALKLQVTLVLLMFPISALLFHGVSLSALIYNLVFVPCFSFVIVPIIFLAFGMSYIAPMSEWLWKLSDLCLMPVTWALEYASWGWFDLSYSQVKWLAIATFLLMAHRHLTRRALLALIMVFMVVNTRWKQSPMWELNVMDVGHGLAVIVKQGKRTLLYDTGAAWDNSSIAAQIITPYLVQSGVVQVDYLILSHMDNDHAGDWLSIVDKWYPHHVLSSQVNIGDSICQKGVSLQWEEITIDVLWPPKPVSRAYNPHSCVVALTHKKTNQRVLLTGDVETIAEWLLVREKEQLKSDVLLVPHHGSRTSSTPAFVEYVDPIFAVASTAKGGRWNLPNQEVVATYQERGAQWLDTGSAGQITVKFYSDSIKLLKMRDIKGDRWYRHMLRKGVE